MRGESGRLRRGRRSIAGQVYHVRFATAARQPIFDELRLGRCVVRELQRLDEHGLAGTLAFVVMPDHVHWLCELGAGRGNEPADGRADEIGGGVRLSAAVNLVKGRSARHINRLRGSRARVWQRGFFDRAIRHEADVVRVARYIVANPVRAGICASPRQYGLWDACWLDGR